MGSSNKRDRDFSKGKVRREHSAKDLNFYLEKHNTGLRFLRRHDYLKTMHISEKVKNNEIRKYITPTAFHEAMALHYILTNKNKLNNIPFIFMYWSKSGGGFYLKVPKEYKQDPKGYLQILTELNYHVIIINEPSEKYSQPVKLQTICKYWKYKMSKSKGNQNRLQFYGSLKTITYLHPEEETLLDPCMVELLKKLME